MPSEPSQRHLCELLVINRSSLWRAHNALEKQEDEPAAEVVELEPVRERRRLVAAIEKVVKEQPSWGYRRVRAWLVRREGFKVSNKTIQKIMKEHDWQVRHRVKTPRPRVVSSSSVASQPNERWAVDATSCWSKRGWVGVMAVIDCCTREIVGVHVSERGRAQEAEAALEQGCLEQFGLVFAKPREQRPVLRSDNGKVFTSKRFTGRCGQYGLTQEFITPYTPQQNGMIERFFRSLKEECIWLHNFEGVEDAREKILEWVKFYNELRPHQSLKYLSPNEFRAQVDLPAQVA